MALKKKKKGLFNTMYHHSLPLTLRRFLGLPPDRPCFNSAILLPIGQFKLYKIMALSWISLLDQCYIGNSIKNHLYLWTLDRKKVNNIYIDIAVTWYVYMQYD